MDVSSDGGDAYPCPHCGAAVPEIGMAHFSFNKPAGACPTCTGLGVVHEADLAQVVDLTRSIAEGAVRGWDTFYIAHHTKSLQAAGKYYGFEFDPAQPINQWARRSATCSCTASKVPISPPLPSPDPAGHGEQRPL